MAPEQVFSPEPDGADAPVAGFYEDVRRGKVALPVRIWFGSPEGEERAPRWQMLLAGRPVDPADEEWARVWPQCAKTPITSSEYDYRIDRIRYAKNEGAPADPWARRSGKIDLLTAPIPE